MVIPAPGRSAGLLSSVTLQLLLNLTSVYFVFYFLFTLSLIIKKSLELPYPSDALVCDVALLLLLAALEFLHFFCGVKGNLTESEGYIFGNLIVTATTILLTVYFLLWQTYVMRADVIIGSVLVAVYGADGVLALSTLARFARLIPQQRKSYADNDEPVKLNGKCLVRGMVQKGVFVKILFHHRVSYSEIKDLLNFIERK